MGKSVTSSESASKPIVSRGPIAVLALGIVTTLGITGMFYLAALRSDTSRFAVETNRIRNAVQAQIGAYVGLLTATRGFVETSGDLDRTKFGRFIGELGLQTTYTGIQGIGYSKVVRPGELEPLVNQIRGEGDTGFAPYPESDRNIEQTVIFLEPQDALNRRAIGFDMSSETNRREALDRARDTGQIAASARVVLVQEMVTTEKQPGFLIYLPSYRDGIVPSTIEERRRAVEGFVYAPFRAGDLFSEIRRSVQSDHLLFEVYEGSEDGTSLLYKDTPESPSILRAVSRPWIPVAAEEIDVYGRKWIIRYQASDTFMSLSNLWWSPVIFLLGISLSLLIFKLLMTQVRNRCKAEQTARELMESEAMNRKLLNKESAARKEAEEASKVKDEFISVVSHELRTPLNAIAGWARVLKGNDLTQMTRDSALEKIERNLRAQATLIDDLLTYSQMASGGFGIHRSEVDMASVVGSALSEVEPMVVEKKLVVQVHDGSCGRLVYGDPEKLRTVALKLFSNAAKFTPSHGQIDVSIGLEDDRMVLCVKDTGRGLSEDFIPFIFERFRQHDSSITRKVGGLGLGLAICEEIIRLHNGTIEASSAGEGKGAEFTVRLPLAKTAGE